MVSGPDVTLAPSESVSNPSRLSYGDRAQASNRVGYSSRCVRMLGQAGPRTAWSNPGTCLRPRKGTVGVKGGNAIADNERCFF
jgi:hypothetical protein